MKSRVRLSDLGIRHGTQLPPPNECTRGPPRTYRSGNKVGRARRSHRHNPPLGRQSRGRRCRWRSRRNRLAPRTLPRHRTRPPRPRVPRCLRPRLNQMDSRSPGKSLMWPSRTPREDSLRLPHSSVCIGCPKNRKPGAADKYLPRRRGAPRSPSQPRGRRLDRSRWHERAMSSDASYVRLWAFRVTPRKIAHIKPSESLSIPLDNRFHSVIFAVRSDFNPGPSNRLCRVRHLVC